MGSGTLPLGNPQSQYHHPSGVWGPFTPAIKLIGARGWESVAHRSLWGQSPGLSAGGEEEIQGGTGHGGDQQGT